jgi:hypothetical protein
VYTDGETFYYRNDRPTRPSARPPSAAAHDERQLDAALGDRIVRLEAVVQRLEATLIQLEGFVQPRAAGSEHQL